MPREINKDINKSRSADRFIFAFPYLIGLFLIAMPALVYYLFVTPDLARMKGGGDLDLNSKQSDLDSATVYLSKVKKLGENFETFQGDPNFEKLKFALPVTQDLPGLFVQLESIAAQSGLTVTALDVSEAQEGNRAVIGGAVNPPVSVVPQLPVGVKKLSIVLRLGAADYPSWKGFIKAIESNLRLFDLVSYNYDPKSTQQTVNLVTYYYKE